MEQEKKKVGNACRTKTQIRHSKARGSAFEMDCEASLQQKFSDAYRTHERGYIQEYDIKSDQHKMVWECKRLKSISWNQLVKFYEKLDKVAPEGYSRFILFQSNNQPCLVFYTDENNHSCIKSFEKMFAIPFIKHESTRRADKIKVIEQWQNTNTS